MDWIYLYQDMNEFCKYITSENPDEWHTMMYYDFLKFLSPLNINDRDRFMFYFSFIGKIIYVDLQSGNWKEVYLDDTNPSFKELQKLNDNSSIIPIDSKSIFKDNYDRMRLFIRDKYKNLRL